MHQRQMILLAVAVLHAAGPACGDGCYFPYLLKTGKATDLVSSPKQEAVLIADEPDVRVILRTHFTAGPEDLAWVVPIPAKPSEIGPGPDVFGDLNDATAPLFTILSPRPFGLHLKCGCGAGGPTYETVDRTVVVEAARTAGIFKYVVLSARDTGALEDWLDSHHYAVPDGAADVMERYVQAGWYWLAMRVRPDKAREPTLAPHPVTYTYQAENLTYPMVISRLSAAAQNEIVLYVLSRRRWRCTNWANMTMDELTGDRLVADDTSPSGTTYEALFAAETARQKHHLFVTEFARDIDNVAMRDILDKLVGRDRAVPSYLTRLRAIMPPGAMDRDVELAAMGRWAPDVTNRLDIYPQSTSQASVTGVVAPLLWMPTLLWTGAALIRRRRRAAGAGLIALACVILTMF